MCVHVDVERFVYGPEFLSIAFSRKIFGLFRRTVKRAYSGARMVPFSCTPDRAQQPYARWTRPFSLCSFMTVERSEEQEHVSIWIGRLLNVALRLRFSGHGAT